MSIKGKECQSCKRWRQLSLFRPFGIIGRKRRPVCKICEYRLIRSLGPLPVKDDTLERLAASVLDKALGSL